MNKPNRYVQIIDTIFHAHYVEGAETVEFEREEIGPVADKLGIKTPKNLGDIPYSFRYRASLPDSITSKAPQGKVWVIKSVGRSLYQFVLVEKLYKKPPDRPLAPNSGGTGICGQSFLAPPELGAGGAICSY